MNMGLMRQVAYRVILSGLVLGSAATARSAPAFVGPVELRVDNLKTPLGIDDPTPSFSWQLHDPARGAKQTAYQVLVASNEQLLSQGKADIWDSGRVVSGESLNVAYKGPAIAASTRSFWRVKAWAADGKPYAESKISWWETGLVTKEPWQAKWIGYETPEEDAVRHATADWITSPDVAALDAEKASEQHTAYRQTLTLPKDCCEKLADTFIAEVIETVHVGVVPEHAPPQPRNVDPAAGLADSVTLEPVK